MSSATQTRVTSWLQLLGILALLISIIILFAAVNQLGHNRKQMVLAGEVSQVLTELRQLASAPPESTGLSDDIARLIGYGDVQTSEIAAVNGSGLFSRESVEQKLAKTALVQTWRTAKRAFASADAVEADSVKGSETDSGYPNQKQQLQRFDQLRESFDRVFAAISQDTLSAELLTANSQLLATLKNLEFVLRNRESLDIAAYNRILHDKWSSLQSEVAQLLSLTNAGSGGVLIGYESRQLLTGFAMQARQFEPTRMVNEASSESRVNESQLRSLATALDSAGNFQRSLDFASHQNRRAILFAIAALCVALICLMLSLWRSWRDTIGGNTSGGEELEVLRTELTAIADGNLTVRASQKSSATVNAIAQASNHTVEMLTGLVRLFRRAGNHLNELAGSQQYLAKRWIKSEIKRHEKLDLLAQNLELQSQAIDQLQEIETSVVAADRSESKHDVSGNHAAIQSLALKVSACRDIVGIAGAEDSYSVASDNNLSGEGLRRMRQRMHELTGAISAVRLAAEQARLQVLNTSLQMTAYAGSAEIDDQSRLVEEIQGISNQLASSAAGAERMSSALADDLQQYAEAFASDKHDLVNHFEQLQQSVNLCLDSSLSEASDESISTSDAALEKSIETGRREVLAATLESAQQQQAVLRQLVAELMSDAEIASDGDAIELLEQIGEIQKISASLARSAEMYGTTNE